MALKIMNEEKAKQIWHKISGNEIICDSTHTCNKNGEIYSATPVEYNGYELMLVLNDFDMLSLHFNRTSSSHAVLSDSTKYMEFDPQEHIPSYFVPYAKALMRSRCQYLDAMNNSWFGGNYQKSCELSYDGCLSYFDLFENFVPGKKVG